MKSALPMILTLAALLLPAEAQQPNQPAEDRLGQKQWHEFVFKASPEQCTDVLYKEVATGTVKDAGGATPRTVRLAPKLYEFTCKCPSGDQVSKPTMVGQATDYTFYCKAAVAEAPPALPLVNTTEVYWSDEAASGHCKDFGGWASVCSADKPEGWTIVSQVFELTGDRAGCAYAKCEPVSVTPTKACYHFSTQGHDEECGHSGNTGIHYSKGKLTVVWAHH